jgi:ribosomal protein S18 acetylase RimI-like enzyme
VDGADRLGQPVSATVGPAGAADLPDIRRLFRAYQASLDVDLCFQGFDAELAALPGRYAAPEGALFIARDAGGEAIGCAALRGLDGTRAEMKRLYVAPAGRGRGLGRRLAEAVIAEARRLGYAELALDTLPSMAGAQAMYEAMGFADIAPYYRTPVDGTRFMALALR